MNRLSRARLPQSDFLKDGTEAFIAGRFNLAASCFEKAHRAEPRDPVPLFNLASAKERLGEIDDAAVHLTRASHTDALVCQRASDRGRRSGGCSEPGS